MHLRWRPAVITGAGGGLGRKIALPGVRRASWNSGAVHQDATLSTTAITPAPSRTCSSLRAAWTAAQNRPDSTGGPGSP